MNDLEALDFFLTRMRYNLIMASKHMTGDIDLLVHSSSYLFVTGEV